MLTSILFLIGWTSVLILLTLFLVRNEGLYQDLRKKYPRTHFWIIVTLLLSSFIGILGWLPKRVGLPPTSSTSLTNVTVQTDNVNALLIIGAFIAGIILMGIVGIVWRYSQTTEKSKRKREFGNSLSGQ